VNQSFLDLSKEQVLGLTICREAGGEPDEGKVAVGTVILERVDRGNRGKDVKEVCLWRRQFSCYDEIDRGYSKTLHMAETWDQSLAEDFSLMDCYSLAVGMVSGLVPRHLLLAKANCLNYLNPRWAAQTKSKWLGTGMKVILVVGKHEFFV
jgi:hypothetical protein